MSRIASLTIVLSSLLCGSAFAHNTVPADWCPSGTTVEIVSEFSFTPSQLQTYRGIQDERSGGEGTCTNAGLKTCGIVDDWFTAYSLTAGVCKGTALRLDAPTKTAAFVLSPASFNAREHHELYEFTDGVLRGVCVTCVAKVRPPIIELPAQPLIPTFP